MSTTKEWFRHNASGDLGYKIEGDKIKFNRPEGAERRFRPDEWTAIAEHRPLAPAHLAEICFNADAKLCFYLGLRENAAKQWIDLNSDQKRLWMTEGPSKDPWRQKLYRAIQKELKGLVGSG